MKYSKIIISALLLTAVSSTAIAQSLDDLYREVEQSVQQEGRINQQREQEFINARNQQRQMLAQARADRESEERRSDRLKNAYDTNERNLAELETVLQERMGNLGELFGVVRQVSGDVQTVLDDSLTSAQLAGRTDFLGELAQRKELPNVNELRQLWLAMVSEIAESGKVVKFNADVLTADGETQPGREVVRVGVFNAISNGKFLVWDTSVGEIGTLVELPRQPAARFQSMAADLQDTSNGTAPTAVDFTRGVILQAVVKSKTVSERLGFGIPGMGDAGIVGYVIMGIGLFGLLLCLWKFVSLFGAAGKMNKQTKNANADKGNALGRVMSVYTDNPDADIETLELKLDEAILRETAPLESSLSFIKVLYVVAPLLGLLGTVVGMINTFQQITLFGTGDPRMMAGGISMALMTTVLGLVVAIPLTLLHSYLQSKSKALIQILEEQAAGIIARLAEKRGAV